MWKSVGKKLFARRQQLLYPPEAEHRRVFGFFVSANSPQSRRPSATTGRLRMNNPTSHTPMELGNVEFANNPEPRVACLIIADVSGSMKGAPIKALNAGLKELQRSLLDDALARLRVEIGLLSFADATRIESDFVSPENFCPPRLTAAGSTNMGAAILEGLDMIHARKDAYRSGGVQYYKPWVWLMTDGEPTDNITLAAQRIRDAEAAKQIAVFAVAIGGANTNALTQLSARPPLKLDGLRFAEHFQWLSASLSTVSASRPGDQPQLPPVTWATP